VKEADSNFPMAIDETNHRLFIGCRRPAKLLVINTDDGRTVASVDCSGDTDDLFYDEASKRIYLTGGDGSISANSQMDANRYKRISTQQTAPGARTSTWVFETKTLFVAVPHRDGQKAEVRAYRAR
jgi:hypothetical protein